MNLIKSFKKSFNIQNDEIRSIIKNQIKDIESMAEVQRQEHNQLEYKRAEDHDSKCPNCKGTIIVNKIARTSGSGYVSGNIFGIRGASSIDTSDVNNCNTCGNQWIKYNKNYKWASDVISGYIINLMLIKENRDYSLNNIKTKLADYYAETIYELSEKNCVYTFGNGISLEFLREHFKSVYDR